MNAQWKEMCVCVSQVQKKFHLQWKLQQRGDKSKGEVCAWMDYGYSMCECVEL